MCNALLRQTGEITDPEDYGFRSCGSNADWSISAWHVGPSKVPNTNEGDVYVLEDDETSNYFVSRRWYDDEEMGDEIEDLGTFATLEEAASAAMEIVAAIG